MAKATQPRSSSKTADAITLLKQDHREVESLFESFKEASDQEAGAIAQKVCQMLTVHAQIDEEILYPAAKEAFEEEEDLELVNEANVEHASAKDLIAQIEEMTEEDEPFKATVTVLSEYIRHHVKEEEEELFPKLKKTGIDLANLGAQLLARKAQLVSKLGPTADTAEGVGEEDDETKEKPAAARRGGARGNSRTPAGAR